MKRAAVIAAGAAVAVVLGCVVWSPAEGAAPVPAQSTLERLEQRIRNRNGQSPDAADKTAEVPASATTREKSAKGPANGPGYVGMIADDAKDRGRGVRVLSVRPDGPAERAGLRPQDLITSVAGTRVRQMTDMADVLALFPAGQSVVFEVLRAERREKVTVTLGRRPQPTEQPAIPPPEPAISPPKAAAAKPPAAGPKLHDPTAPAAPASPAEQPAETEIERLRRRVDQLERRVAELERKLPNSPK